MRMLTLFGLGLALPTAASAATLSVSPTPDIDQLTLAQALSTASDGDVLALEDGSYGDLSLTDGRTLTVTGDGNDVSFRSVLIDGTSTSLTVQGVRIEGGSMGVEARGGSITLDSVEMHDIGEELAPGVAIRVETGASLSATGLTVRGVYSQRGAVEIQTESAANFEGVAFIGNRSETDGGAMRIEGGNVRIAGALMSDNNAAGGGGAIAALNGDIEIEDAVFTSNTADAGGAVFVGAGARVNASDLQMESNQADVGGAAFVFGGELRGARATFEDSSARIGAGIAVDGGTVSFSNTSFTNGAAIEQGGAAYISKGELTLVYSVMVDNAASIAGGVAQSGGELLMRGIIAADNMGEAIASAGGIATFEQSIMWNNEGIGGTLGVDMDQTVLEVPPDFVDAKGGDYALAVGSPGLDRGVANLADLDGTPADMGMFGGPLAWSLPDADGDGYVYGRDCDDGDADIHENADDRWYDGIDSDCDGEDDFDQDGDGFSASPFDGTDCDDTNSAIFPGATETEGDAFDVDCDGLEEPDMDGDGWGSDLDCDDDDASVNPDAKDSWYDGIDADCNGASDFDQDGDGYDDARFGGDDCDDTDAFRSPGTAEIEGDGVDQDCDGEDLQPEEPAETAEVTGEIADETEGETGTDPSMAQPRERTMATTGCSTTGAGGMGGMAALVALMGLAVRRRD